MKRKRWVVLAIAGLLGLSTSAAAADPARVVLARVDGEPITLKDLQRDFERRHQGHMSMLADEPVVRDFLDAAIKRRLFIQEGRRLALQDDAVIVERVEAERIRLTTAWLYESEVENRVRIGEDQVDAAVRASHIAVEIVRVQTDTREEAQRARERMVAGEAPSTVAREMSTARSRLRGGLEGINWGRADPVLEQALWAAAEGDVVGPVMAADAWHVARIVRRRDQTADPSRQPDRGRLRAVLESRRRDAVRAEYLDALGERYDAVIRSERLEPEVLVPMVQRQAEEASAEAGEPATEREDAVLVATFEGGGITLAEFVQTIRPRAFLALRPAAQRVQARQLLQNAVDDALVRLEAVRRSADIPGEVQRELRSIEDDLIFRALLDRLVFSDLKVSETDVTRYLDAHRDEYVEPMRIQLAVALLDSEQTATEFRQALQEGADFADLARERSTDPLSAAQGGESGWVKEDQAIAELRGEPFRQAVGHVGGPIRIDRGWLFYRVLDRREARPLPEDRARETVREVLLGELAADRMKHWEDQLRAASSIDVSQRGIRRASEILAAERAERKLDPPGKAPGVPHGGGA